MRMTNPRGAIAYFWQGAPNGVPQLGIAVGLSLFAVITLAAVLGALLPWLLLKLGFDHGPAADPFITTIKDFTKGSVKPPVSNRGI